MNDCMIIALFASACCGYGLWAVWESGDTALSRLEAVAAVKRRSSASRIGLAMTIASAIAYVRSGGTLLDAFGRQHGMRFAVARLTAERLYEVLASQAERSDSEAKIKHVAMELEAACQVSTSLGCEAARCLEAASASLRRAELLEDLRKTAFAMPKATVNMLTVLPLITLVLGEILGARPVAFLLSGVRGWLCLIIGGAWYGLGLLWVRVLMRNMDSEILPSNSSRGEKHARRRTSHAVYEGDSIRDERDRDG